MFNLTNWQNPETLGLNITNAALGLAVLVGILLICRAAIHEFGLPGFKHHHHHDRH